MRFMNACGVSNDLPTLSTTKLYTSHEALLLPYEQALTRQDPNTGEWFGCSGSFLWIGERTRQLDGASVEYMRGISNPIGVKISTTMQPVELLTLMDVLNPTNEPGRLTLITRMGADNIEKYLPPLLRAVKAEGRNVVWMTDSMHGNTYTAKSGFKTRNYEDIAREVNGFFKAHKAEGTGKHGDIKRRMIRHKIAARLQSPNSLSFGI
jgi:3-deoxy-7-phosphoheptulonate synthase